MKMMAPLHAGMPCVDVVVAPRGRRGEGAAIHADSLLTGVALVMVDGTGL
jgi:hypothetical protein